jgi:hypothetical protein
MRVGDTSLRSGDLTRLGPDGVIRSLTPGTVVNVQWKSNDVVREAKVKVAGAPQPRG